MKNIIEFALSHRFLMCVLGTLVMATGLFCYTRLPIDAFPDTTPTLVQVFTETDGLSPEEVEKFITYPVETHMNGLPGLKEVRSISNFGLSVINVYFHDNIDIYFARQLVGERLQEAREEIPQGLGSPQMGPISTGLGQILFYVLEDETQTRSPEEMRDIQDWIVKFNLQTVPGVTEVLSIGGEVRQFQVRIRPDDLLRYDLTIQDIKSQIEANNSNIGAQFLVKNAEEYVIRSIGLVETIGDLAKIVVKPQPGAPVYLDQVADIVIGGEIRRGLATMNGEGEVVAGMVLKLIGTNTSRVIADVKLKLDDINRTLPEGVSIVPYYDQADLVARCVETVTHAMFSAILLVIAILLLFMGSIRPSIVVALAIPFSLLFAFILMSLLGITANLMSLGGLTIAIGMMIDAALVIAENIDRWLRDAAPTESRRAIVAKACAEIATPVIFSIVNIIVVFLPLLTLQGVEGKTFAPLAKTVMLGMLGSLIYAIFIAPVLSHLLMRRRAPEAKSKTPRETLLIRALIRVYRPCVTFFVKNRGIAIGLAGSILLLGVLVFPRLGSEFVPRLDEGSLLIRATMAPSISLEEARDTMLRFERRLMKDFPEITRIVSRVGRGEIGAHADPVNSAEALIELRPTHEWTTKETPAQLYQRISESLETFPGAQFNVTQPIAAATDELITGTRADLAIKLFGPDMEILKDMAAQIESRIRTLPGATDVQMDQITGTPQIQIHINRAAIARYGLNIHDVQELLAIAVGGESVGQVFDGIKRADIFLRFEETSRGSIEALRKILIPTPGGLRIPLEQVATIQEVVGPRQITRENNQRFITVQCNVRGRDVGSFVTEGQALLEKTIALPDGYFIQWGGQFELQQEANQRLALVVPISLLIIVLLVFMGLGSVKSTLLILLNIPLALVGGVLALWLTAQNLSVPASVGFIALFGIALENGMVLITTLNQRARNAPDIDEASIQCACIRLRPVFITATTTALALIPILLSTGAGSEIQRPLATVVLGGLVTSTILTLLILPAFYKWFRPTHPNTTEEPQT
ncbi:MAG: CusA/CzcA family heavy metal efflux RND transporter [Proteobacteria bacterium]|nr:CusA/CzcA family heavy metal efflux RND transporter [Pseudomonadota bacterium]